MDNIALRALLSALAARREGDTALIASERADLRQAELSRADLRGARLAEARLDFTQLAGALLRWADLERASLTCADLSAADLTGAKLHRANLSGVRLEGACLADADLSGALLVGVMGRPASVAGMRIDFAAAERSGLSDEEVLSLIYEGAVICDLHRFSETIRRASQPAPASRGASVQALLEIELEIRHQIAQLDGEPSSAPYSSARGLSSGPPASLGHAVSRLSNVPVVAPDSITPGSDADTGVMRPYQPGDVVLGATLNHIIHRGKLSTVWHANSTDDKDVAVRVFNHAMLGMGLSAAAFRRGVTVMLDLNTLHELPPSICRTFGASDNRLAIVSAFNQGNCREILQMGWDVPQRVEWFTKLCEAIAFAHDHGILHRCLKPSNVLLDDAFNPVVVDFDMVDLPLQIDPSTKSGGYGLYAAPEELLGAGTQSPSADVYSLGRILHLLLLGDDPPHPLAAEPDVSGLRHVPEGLVRIIRRATMAEPTLRYPQVSELLGDILRYEQHQRVGYAALVSAERPRKRKPSTLHRQRSWLKGRAKEQACKVEAVRRRRERFLAATGAVLLAVATGWVLSCAVPSPSLAHRAHQLAAVGAALLCFAIPAAQLSRVRLMRLCAALVLAATIVLIGPEPLLKMRLLHTLERGDVETRSLAVARMMDLGLRQLAGQQLAGTQLSELDLGGTDLRNTFLDAADLSRASLIEASFDGASLYGTKLLGADLTAANPHAAAGWDTIECDEHTLMPKGWSCIDGSPSPSFATARAP